MLDHCSRNGDNCALMWDVFSAWAGDMLGVLSLSMTFFRHLDSRCFSGFIVFLSFIHSFMCLFAYCFPYECC